MFTTNNFLLLRNILTISNTKVVNVLNLAQNFGQKFVSTTAFLNASHYETLGIPESSTQSDIKAAYYKLSKQYHPDKNQGSETAVKKFREISQAYEILGNYRLRRLYDKGVIHTAGSQYAQHTEHVEEDIVEDDAETKFYKSRFKKSKVTDMSGRTPIYDFDEWSRAHYGKSFQRRQDAHSKFQRKEREKVRNVTSLENEIFLFGMIITGTIMYMIFREESSLDTPKEKAMRRAAEDQKRSSES